MPFHKTGFNRDKHEKIGEKFTKPSMTIPDQTMSIPTLIKRYVSGQTLGGSKIPVYEGDEDLLNGVNWQTLDLSEKAAYMKQFAYELKDHKEKQTAKSQPAKENIKTEERSLDI